MNIEKMSHAKSMPMVLQGINSVLHSFMLPVNTISIMFHEKWGWLW